MLEYQVVQRKFNPIVYLTQNKNLKSLAGGELYLKIYQIVNCSGFT